MQGNHLTLTLGLLLHLGASLSYYWNSYLREFAKAEALSPEEPSLKWTLSYQGGKDGPVVCK